MSDPRRARILYNRHARHFEHGSLSGNWVERKWIEPLRREVVSRAYGDVLEIGIGTGRTLAHYGPQVCSLTGLDVSENMLALCRQRQSQCRPRVRLLLKEAETLPFADGTFDCVVSSLCYCGISTPVAAMAEVARVLRPGGVFLLVEHIRPLDYLLAKPAEWVSPLTDRFIGCRWDRPTPALLREAGFRVRTLSTACRGILVAMTAEKGTCYFSASRRGTRLYKGL